MGEMRMIPIEPFQARARWLNCLATAGASASLSSLNFRRVRRVVHVVLLLLAVTALAAPPQPQPAITILFVDFKTGKPIKDLSVVVTLWNGTDLGVAHAEKTVVSEMNMKTDKSGTVTVRLTVPLPDHLNIFAGDLAAAVSPRFSPREVLDVGGFWQPAPQLDGKAAMSPMSGSRTPGQIVILNKKLTAWDKTRKEFP